MLPSSPSTTVPTDLVPAPSSFHFDEQKIASTETYEKKELFLFQWIHSLEKDLSKSTREIIKPYQSEIEKTLLKVLSGIDPKPNRPIRQIGARCFILLYNNGDSRSLFDTLSGLQNLLGNKKLEDVQVRLSLMHVMGALTESHGSKLLSLFPETVNLLSKQYKNAREADISIRYEALTGLSSSIKGAGKAATDSMLKECMKFARNGLGDRYSVIKLASAQLMESLYLNTNLPPPLRIDEYESLVVFISKNFEGSDVSLRRIFASLMASIMKLSLSTAPTAKETSRGFGRFIGLGSSTPNSSETQETRNEKTILSVDELFLVYINVLLKVSNKEIKVGILESLAFVLKQLGVGFLETNYSTIVKRLIDMVTSVKLNSTKYDSSFIRESVSFILRDVVGKSLGELGQINAAKELVNNWIRKWPPVTGNEIPPSDIVLSLLLDELGSLLIDLGPAVASTADVIIDPLAILLSHPSQSVNLSLSKALRCLCISLPDQLTRFIAKLVNLLQRETGPSQIDKVENMDRIIGYGNVLANLICVIPHRPLYISYESAAMVFGISTQLIKGSSVSKDSALGAAQSLVAWTLIGSLMTLGSAFVKVHVSQLLLIWKNCFPKVVAKDSTSRTELEWQSLLLTRYAALSALFSFLTHNKDLITSDVSKRVVVFLNNVLNFIFSLPVSYSCGGIQLNSEIFQMKLLDREALIKTRLLQCYAAIQPIYYEMIGPQLIKFAIDNFLPDPEKSDRWAAATQNSNDKTPAPEVNLCNSLVDGFWIKVAEETNAEERGIGKALTQELDIGPLESLLTSSTFSSIDYDPCWYFLNSKQLSSFYYPQLPSIELSNASIGLFSILFPLQTSAVQETCMELILKYTTYTGSKISAQRKYSLILNSIIAIIGSLKYIMNKKGSLSSIKVSNYIEELVGDLVSHSDTLLRVASAELLGRLSRVANNPLFVNSLYQKLIDEIVNNRDPFSRSGCCLALGTISSYMGGLASGPHLKNIVGILHSLAADSHCLVHTWALHALWLTIESAGLMYGPFVNSTLTLVTKLFTSENHEPVASHANMPDGDRNVDVFPAFGRILHALVGVLGPELHASPKVRDLFFSLYDQLRNDSDPFVVAEAIKCVQQFILFAPKLIDTESLVPFLQRQLSFDSKSQMRRVAIHCLYQLTQRDASSVLVSSVQLEEQLFSLLDIESDDAIQAEIKDILMNLLKFVAAEKPTRWLELCKNILAKGNMNSSHAPKESLENPSHFSEEDDQVLSNDHVPPIENTLDNSVSNVKSKQIILVLLPRWKTQIFALVCLRRVLSVCWSSGIKAHFDLELARTISLDFVILKLVEFIRISFNCATSNLYELKLEGLLLLQDILKRCCHLSDPDFEGHALLEQYQAQITSALAPAFEVESGPELLATAYQVCALYIASGIHSDVSTLNRLVRLFNSHLDLFVESKSKESFPNGKLIQRISILSSWAQIYVASLRFTQLGFMIQPNLEKLSLLWINTLYDYARLNLDSEMATNSLQVNGTELSVSKKMDVYVAAVKQIVQVHYVRSWTVILKAITSILKSLAHLEKIMLKQELDSGNPFQTLQLLLGLCIESLSNTQSLSASKDEFLDSESDSSWNSLIICIDSCAILLQKLKLDELNFKILFMETMTVYDRLMQTESILVQQAILDNLKGFSAHFTFSLEDLNASPILKNEFITGSVEAPLSLLDSCPIPTNSKVYKMIKVLFNVFLNHVPGLSHYSNTAAMYHSVTKESTDLIVSAFELFLDFVKGLSTDYTTILYPLEIYLFTALLDSEILSVELGSHVLKLFKKNIQSNSDSWLSGALKDTLQLSMKTLLDNVSCCSFENEDLTTQYTKNGLLGLVILVTQFPKATFELESQREFVLVLLENLSVNNPILAITCVQCIKSLLLLSASTDPIVQSIGSLYCRLLLPGFFKCLNTFVQEQSLELVDEILKMLTLVHASLPLTRVLVQVLLKLLPDIPESLIPVFHSMFDRQLFMQSTSTLLSIVGKDSAYFKTLLVELGPDSRIKLERALKSYSGMQNNSTKVSGVFPPPSSLPSTATAAPPKIQLKNFTL